MWDTLEQNTPHSVEKTIMDTQAHYPCKRLGKALFIIEQLTRLTEVIMVASKNVSLQERSPKGSSKGGFCRTAKRSMQQRKQRVL